MSNDTTIPDGFKRCNKCLEIKPFSAFSRNPSAKNGLRSHCRECVKIRQAKYLSDPEKKRRSEESSRAWAVAHPERTKASSHRSYLKKKSIVLTRSRLWAENNKERKKELRLANYQKNKEVFRERERRYKEEQPERTAEYSRKWREKHPEKAIETRRRFHANNKERLKPYYREQRRKRKARKRSATTANISCIVEVMYFIQGFECIYCQKTLSFDDYHVDHILPLALVDVFGKQHPGHTPPNLALTCIHCNSSKQSALLEDWLSRKYPAAMDTILHRVEYHIAIMTTLYELCGEDNRKWQQILDELERGLSIEEILG